MNSDQPLLQPHTMRDLELPNRVAMAPMTRSRATRDDRAPTADMHGKYYAQRASAGLIITEGTQVSQRGTGYIYTPGIYTQAHIDGWKKVTEKVHAKEGHIFMQLWHEGRISHPSFHDGDLPVAPSAINPEAQVYTHEGMKDTVTPKAMSKKEIEETVQEFVQGAANAMEAGMDGVEIHSSNGYLFHQFFNNCSNTRSDEYGGSHENKARILFEVIEGIREVMPENRIGLRLNPSLHGQFSQTVDEDTIPTFDYIIKRLNEYDLAYLHLSEPFTDVSDVPHAEPEIAKRYRPMYNGTLIINSAFDHESGNAVIERGDADMVAYGKPYISNPDLVERFANNIELADWDSDTFYTQGKEGYLDYERAEENKKEVTT